MEEEHTIRGTVEEISSQLFVVSAVIEDHQKFLWVQHDRLFVHGSRFTGGLSNVLEERMEIDLIVKQDIAGDYVVLAAWIGVKPDIIEVENHLLMPIYNEKGELVVSGSTLMIARNSSDHKILITRRDIVYLGGILLDKGVECFAGHTVSFDARPLSFKDPTGALFYATCVWLGDTEPKLEDRFRLQADDVRVKQEKADTELESLESPVRNVTPNAVVEIESDDDIEITEVIRKEDVAPVVVDIDSDDDLSSSVKIKSSSLFAKYGTGTVCAIPSSELALVDVRIDDVEVKAMLPRKSLDRDCQDIRAVLSVGDRVCMLLRSLVVANSTGRWCVVKASKGNPNPRQLAERLLPLEETLCVKTEKVGTTVQKSVPTSGPANDARAAGNSASAVPVPAGNGESTSSVPVPSDTKHRTASGSVIPVRKETGNSSLVSGDSAPAVPVPSDTKHRTASGSGIPVRKETGNGSLVSRDSAPAVPVRTGDGNHAQAVQGESERMETEPSNLASVTGNREQAPRDLENKDSLPIRIKTEFEDVIFVEAFSPRVTTLKPVAIQSIKRKDIETEMILNGTGKLAWATGGYCVADMDLIPVRVLIHSNSFFVDGKISRPAYCKIGTEIQFDAKVFKKSGMLGSVKTHQSKATHQAVLSWTGKKPSPQTVLTKAKIPHVCNLKLQPDVVYCGLVMEVPLLDCCIVKFGAVPVLIPAKSLLVDPWTKDTSPVVISDYLKFGDHVALTCKVQENCVVAEVCGTLLSSNTSLFGAIGILDTKSLSVANIDVNVSKANAESQLISMLRCVPLYLEEKVAYKGIIASFPFRNYAIATVGEIRVLIHVNNVIAVNNNQEDTGSKHLDCITTHLTIGSTVLLWVGRKVAGMNSYYFAKEVRLILENSVKNKVVLKNYRGIIVWVEPVVWKQVIQLHCKRRVSSNIHAFRLFREESGGPAALSKVQPKVKLLVNVRVNMAVNNDDDTIHSVWLP